jgi:hypothetical protein
MQRKPHIEGETSHTHERGGGEKNEEGHAFKASSRTRVPPRTAQNAPEKTGNTGVCLVGVVKSTESLKKGQQGAAACLPR